MLDYQRVPSGYQTWQVGVSPSRHGTVTCWEKHQTMAGEFSASHGRRVAIHFSTGAWKANAEAKE